MNAEAPDDSIALGLSTAAPVASFLSIVLMIGSAALFVENSLPELQDIAPALGWFFLYWLVGIPIAWATMLPIGAALWHYMAKEGPITQLHAAKLGAVAGAIVGVFETIAVIAFAGSLFFNAEGNAAVLKHIFDVACTIGIGAICGVVANQIAGPAKPQPPAAA